MELSRVQATRRPELYSSLTLGPSRRQRNPNLVCTHSFYFDLNQNHNLVPKPKSLAGPSYCFPRPIHPFSSLPRHPPRCNPTVSCSAQSQSSPSPTQEASPQPPRTFRIPSLYQSLKVAVTLALSLLLIQGLANGTVNLALTYAPPLLTYATMALVVWPWIAAFALGALTLSLASKRGNSADQSEGDTSSQQVRPVAYLLEQVVILMGALTWLILVPCGHFQGYLGAWPLSLFSVYVSFFAESAFIRSFLYGDLASKAQDKQWATPSSRIAQVLFVVALVGCHWYAAWESPLTALAMKGITPSRNIPAIILLFFSLWLHWDSTLILGKFFDRLVPPQMVVSTGPYRWIRHPIYTSYMLLFSGFCVGLRSYKSLAVLLVTCLWYYSIRTKLEEDQLVEHFGEEYAAYQKRVDKKFLPYLF